MTIKWKETNNTNRKTTFIHKSSNKRNNPPRPLNSLTQSTLLWEHEKNSLLSGSVYFCCSFIDSLIAPPAIFDFNKSISSFVYSVSKGLIIWLLSCFQILNPLSVGYLKWRNFGVDLIWRKQNLFFIWRGFNLVQSK